MTGCMPVRIRMIGAREIKSCCAEIAEKHIDEKQIITSRNLDLHTCLILKHIVSITLEKGKLVLLLPQGLIGAEAMATLQENLPDLRTVSAHFSSLIFQEQPILAMRS